MANVTVSNARKDYGAFHAIKGVSVEIENGEFVVLVGPSGCGKSTLLRMIAGLEGITSGAIQIGTHIVNELPPKDRDIAMVFQNYALYPHMTVAQNMGFALKLKRMPKTDIKARVDRAARILGLEFDPSHLLRIGVDPFEALEGVKDHIKILHAKDTSIDAGRLQAVGYHGSGWWQYRLPGKGKLDWPKFIRQAQSYGFDGTISIEHEDADFGWPGKDLAARKEGERLGLSFLRNLLESI